MLMSVAMFGCSKDNTTEDFAYSMDILVGKWCAYQVNTSTNGWQENPNPYTIKFSANGTFTMDGSADGTYTATGNTIILYVNGEELYRYEILKFEDNQMYVKQEDGTNDTEYKLSKYGMLKLLTIDVNTHEPLSGVLIHTQSQGCSLLDGIQGTTDTDGMCNIPYPCPAVVSILADYYPDSSTTCSGATTLRLKAGETMEATIIIYYLE